MLKKKFRIIPVELNCKWKYYELMVINIHIQILRYKNEAKYVFYVHALNRSLVCEKFYNQ